MAEDVKKGIEKVLIAGVIVAIVALVILFIPIIPVEASYNSQRLKSSLPRNSRFADHIPRGAST